MTRLTLPKLKTFRTTHLFGGYLVLDAPQLINLSLNDHFLKLVHPQTIEKFETFWAHLANWQAISESFTETLPFFVLNYNLIAGFDLFSARRLPRQEMVMVKNKIKNELAFRTWLKKSNTLLEILCRHPLSHDLYSKMLPTSCAALQFIFLIFAEPLSFKSFKS